MFGKLKKMGGKGSKIGKHERTEIIQQVRRTIQRSTTSNERSNLANQFQRASTLNVDEYLAPLLAHKKHKSFVSAVRKGELPNVIRILTGGKVGINEVLDGDTRVRPIHLAAMLQKPDILNSMLHLTEIEVNATTREGDTPLLLALKACGSSADELEACLQTVNLLVEDKRTQIGRMNAIGASPLSVAIAKGLKSAVHALVASNRIRVYERIDLAMAIKLAFIYDRDDLVDLIFSEMDTDSKDGFMALLEQNSDLRSLARHLQERELVNKPQARLQVEEAASPCSPRSPRSPISLSPRSSPGGNSGHEYRPPPHSPLPPPSREYLRGYYSEYAKEDSLEAEDDQNETENASKDQKTLTPSSGRNGSPKKLDSTPSDALAAKKARDMYGHLLRIGNVVEIADERTVRKLNPRIAKEKEFIESVADSRAYIHDIDAEGDMYIDVIDARGRLPIAGHVTAGCAQFVESGPRTFLGDGRKVAVGYYVRVTEDEDEVKDLAKGHGGWHEEMKEFCGRTGRVRKIDSAGDIFVYFPGGASHCYNPKALGASSAAELEAKDVNGEILQADSLARLINDASELRHLQEEIGADFDSRIVGKLIKISRLRLFLQHCDALVTVISNAAEEEEKDEEGPASYYVNPRALRRIPPPHDSEDRPLAVGDRVRVLSQRNAVRALQTTDYGNWVDKMDNLLGQTGTVIDIQVNPSEETPDSPVTRVEFTDPPLGAFFLNPRVVQKIEGDDEAHGTAGIAAAAVSPVSPRHGWYGVEGDPAAGPPAGHSPRMTPTEDPGYGSASGLQDVGRYSRERENERARPRNGSLASILSDSSGLGDGLQLIARKDLEMRRKLGEGGFGCVTSGSWRGTDCAIKQIRPIVTSEIDYDDILKEARIQYGLKHPNIVTLYGISYEQDLWMVMQLVDGMDLHSILFGRDRNGNREKVAYSFKLKISVQATNAISYLHEKGFLHNDIKPENIMIEKKTGNVLICDFGITRYLGKTDLRTYSQKYTDAFGGTLPYIAPECFQRDPVERRYLRPTFKSDIWALSAVFIELFTEREIFPTEKALYQCKIMKDYSGVKITLKSVPDSTIRTLLRRGIDPEPDARPAATEMNGVLFDIMRAK